MADKVSNPNIRVRFAPSPTGHWHIGGARTALFNWLFARHEGGAFILRSEDTDRERSKPEYEIELLKTMEWLGLDWDEGPTLDSEKGPYGPYRQSERIPLYRKYLEKLFDEGKIYYCYCTKEELEAERNGMAAQGFPPKYGGHCRNLKEAPAGKNPQAIRFKMPEAKVAWKDMIRGEVEFDAGLFGDVIIAKNLDAPLYNFAVVVDDYEMKISHVIRGEEHISNTPKQILMARALGFSIPEFGHFPLILSSDRKKMSKRYTETALINYRDDGYLPEALVNFLALLGWHPKEDKEILSLDELIKEFEIKRVQKAGAIFNPEKLDWLNGQYIKALPNEELLNRLEPFFAERGIKAEREKLLRMLEAEKERMRTLQDFFELGSFFFKLPDYAPELLIWKDDPKEKTGEVLEKILQLLENESAASFKQELLSTRLSGLTEEYGRGSVFWPLRVAVSGSKGSPDPLSIIDILGKEETLERLHIALEKLQASK